MCRSPESHHLILIRTTFVSPRVAQLAEELAAASRLPVAFLHDARHPVTIDTPRPTVPLTRAGCERLGLYCPDDFAWRCGDYGLYVSREAFPQADPIWLVEYDVRIGGNAAVFFDFFRDKRADLLAIDLRPAEKSWFWSSRTRSRDAVPYRCLFSMLRISGPAIEALLEKRRQHSRWLQRRALWPNDEAFSATTLTHAGFRCADINSFGRTFYGDGFSYDRPIDGARFAPSSGEPRLYHPVLFGDEYARKIETLRRDRRPVNRWSVPKLRAFNALNRMKRW